MITDKYIEKIEIIFEKVKNGKITHDEARTQVLFLFDVIKHNQKWLWILGLFTGWMTAAICFILLW